MSSRKGGWEGYILLFIAIYTVLIGVAYNSAVMYHVPVPWLVILVVSLAVTLGLRYLRRRR